MPLAAADESARRNAHRTKSYRSRNPLHADNFNFCSVPLSGADAFLFAALALLAASVCMGKLQSVWVLIIGEWAAFVF